MNDILTMDKLNDATVPPHAKLVKKYQRCGKPRCKCNKGELHGPYYHFTWKDRKGKINWKYLGKLNIEEFLHGFFIDPSGQIWGTFDESL